jgi:hypothetical protein
MEGSLAWPSSATSPHRTECDHTRQVLIPPGRQSCQGTDAGGRSGTIEAAVDTKGERGDRWVLWLHSEPPEASGVTLLRNCSAQARTTTQGWSTRRAWCWRVGRTQGARANGIRRYLHQHHRRSQPGQVHEAPGRLTSCTLRDAAGCRDWLARRSIAASCASFWRRVVNATSSG